MWCRPTSSNSIYTSDRAFAYAPAAAGVGWVTDVGDETLAGDERISGLARCLGDVVAARIEQGAVGVRVDGTEVFCVDGDLDAVKRLWTGTCPPRENSGTSFCRA